MLAFPADKYDLQPKVNIADVFSAVQKGEVRYGVVPVENSTNGPVTMTLDLFVDAQSRHPDILIEGEIYLPVHHCLLGQSARSGSSKLSKLRRKLADEDSGTCTPTQAQPIPQMPRVKPSQDISHIKKVYSHPQAWGQCKLFINTYLKGIEQQDVSSTARAAQMVADEEEGTSAAISSRIAGEVNGLELLAEGIEDKEGNTTRFFILRNTQDVSGSLSSLFPVSNPAAAASSSSNVVDASTLIDDEIPDKEKLFFKTLISFTINHGEPGALADSLAVFKKYHLNLSSINSRPSTESAWHYVFFVEILGRKLQKGGKVNMALEELGGVTKEWRWLGSWAENQLLLSSVSI